MSDLISNIIKINSSSEYLRYKKYHEGNIFAITRTSRQEHMHSAFIAWILDSQASHDLKDFPIKQFMSALIQISKREENTKAVLGNRIKRTISDCIVKDEESIISSVEVELPIYESNSKKTGQIDILVQAKISGKILPIIIENKVFSTEHNDQTEKYYEWAKKRFVGNKYFDPIFVFLKPLDKLSLLFLNYFFQLFYRYLLMPHVLLL